MRWGETSPGVIGFISGIVAPQLLFHTAAAHGMSKAKHWRFEGRDSVNWDQRGQTISPAQNWKIHMINHDNMYSKHRSGFAKPQLSSFLKNKGSPGATAKQSSHPRP